MPRRCSICDHTERAAIDAALVGNDPLRGIARTFRVSEDAITRHKTQHLPAHLAKAEEAKEVTQAGSLLDQLLSLNRETMTILREARSDGKKEGALRAMA